MSVPNEPQLEEKDFIQESYGKNPFPFWLWLFLVTAFSAIVWGSSEWYLNKLNALLRSSPFLRVTNRDMSLFLWQNPEFMRINAKDKNGYLTGFQYIDKISMETATADQFSVAPPEVLFRYHTWHRLVSQDFSPRPIPIAEFKEFLNYAEEWLPQNWPQAPEAYVKLVPTLNAQTNENLAEQPETALPHSVRVAFQGWQNFFKEGEAINQLQVTNGDLGKFIKRYPHYARNYWRNIVEFNRPDYLKTFTFSTPEPGSKVPDTELSAFLKVALFNFLKSNSFENQEGTETKPSS